MKSLVRATLVIAWETLLGAVRSRLLLVGLFFAVVLMALSVAAASVSLGERGRLIVDVGLAAASGMGSLIAIALGVATFATSIEKHTAYPILVRPVPRASFVLGRYLGVTVAMQLVVTLMILATAATVVVYGERVPAALWGSLWLGLVEMALVSALAVLCSTFTVPVLAATYSVALVIAGNLANDVAAYGARLARHGSPLGILFDLVYYALPDLAKLSLRTEAANHLPIPAQFVLLGTAYGLAYAALVLIIATWIFGRRRAV